MRASIPTSSHPDHPTPTSHDPEQTTPLSSDATAKSRPSLQRKSASISPTTSENALPSPGKQPLPLPSPSRASPSKLLLEDNGRRTDEIDMEEQQVVQSGRGGGKQSASPGAMAAPEAIEMARAQKLKEAINEKMSYSQQRAQMLAAQSRMSPSLAARRVSPIKEEALTSNLSPTLDASFNSPLPTGAQTNSTESTESARTIRGSVPSTPSQMPLRTPSYPFPYVPGTPRVWSSAFHRPFTTLSPTVSLTNVHDREAPRHSETSTPAASAAIFMPEGATPMPEENTSFPAPNLYDVTLALNMEPGLDAWWSTVSRILTEYYGAERASLAVPADAGELENVPWGQKATYNVLGPTIPNPEMENPEGRSIRKENKFSPTMSAPLRNVFHEEDSSSLSTSNVGRGGRPSMIARHSYAGYERERNEITATPTPSGVPQRPAAMTRTQSYAPRTMSQNVDRSIPEKTPSRVPVQTPLRPIRTTTFSDPDFSSAGSGAEKSDGPFASVLPVLRALNYESHALLDPTGVNRVIERGKVITLTRDYSNEETSPRVASIRRNESTSVSAANAPSLQTAPTDDHPKPLQPTDVSRDRLNDRTRLTREHLSRDKLFPSYEEYEQAPTSPWAQSPAPSPAIQADPDENPFFSSSNVDEESFNPQVVTPDYAQVGQVEAIGVDKASTIIHIPLIHPLLSQNIPAKSRPHKASGVRFSDIGIKHDGAAADDHAPSQKRAPIAILSILSPIVPFFQNLLLSLKLLSPHLATSFANAHQYTNASKQATSILQRRLQGGSHPDFPSFASDAGSLQLIMDADIDNSNESTAGSITSPSDYSGRSGGSILGTPGLDSASMFARQSVGSTPGQPADMVDSYFEAKRWSNLPRTGSSGALPQLKQGRGRESPTLDARPSGKKVSIIEEFDDTAKQERRTRTISQDERSTTGITKRLAQSTPKTAKLISPNRLNLKSSPEHQGKTERKRHTLLHSYGADFSSTFQNLPVTATPVSREAGQALHADQGEEIHTMPPPSERLLRTIIDSLPVQIFTAAPSSGVLTWVNSKFVAYRGKEPYQIIEDPWDAIHRTDRDQYMEEWQRSLSTGQSFAHKVRLLRFDNVYRWFFVRATPLKDKKQNIVHWTGTYMDIHEQHVAEANAARQQETAASEAKYRALANSSPQIVFAVTRTRGVVFCNSQWLTYSGQTEAQARGLGFTDFVHPDDLGKCRLPTMSEDGTHAVDVPTTMPPEPERRDSSLSSSDGSSETSKTVTSPGTNSPPQLPQAKLSELATAGILKVSKDSDGRPSYSTEVRLRNKEGEFRWHLVRVLLSARVREDDEDEEETWYGTCTDINDHKLLEQTLKEAMDAKSRFLSNMSHEIRTPLNGITGMVNFLIDSSLTQEQLEHVHIIRSSTDGLRDLINDILDLSKVEAGMITLQTEWLHLRSLIEEVNDLTAPLATSKGLELNYLIEEGVPSMLKGDRFRIRQVLLNVVGNAIKFTQEGEVFVNCQVYNDRQSRLLENEICLLFQIMDTGSGFTEKEAEFLFKRFSQIDSSITKQHSGTGLGLAISMQLVELHGGRMRATSVPGKGSTFTFTLKFTLPSAEDQPPPPIGSPVLMGTVTTPAVTGLPTKVTTPYTPGPSSVPSLQSQTSFSGSDSSAYPSPIRFQHHDSAASSGSSDPSIRTGQTSVGSHRSSASSLSEVVFNKAQPMALELPAHLRGGRPITLEEASNPSSNDSLDTVVPFDDKSLTPGPRSPLVPPMFSILVVCPLLHSREATVKHIEMTIPRTSPHHITAPDSLDACKRMLGVIEDEQPVLFTHIIINIHEESDIVAFADHVLRTASYSGTSLVIISDFQQRKEIEERAAERNYKNLVKETDRLRWVFKPLKPSKFAIIFDPQKQRELSTDRSKDSAQAVVVNQKQVFDELRARLGNKGLRVLLVEDNKTNQMVLLKFLKKVEINVESVYDGAQCTDKVFSQPHDYFSIILCDLHMPNKDGYQTCKDIRKWERRNKYMHLPIIALSANVLGDVYAKCVEAGFNSYVTKPVDFKELSSVMTSFLDPVNPGRPHEFMRKRS